MKTLRKDNRGAALVYVLLTVTLAAILGTGLMMLIVNRVRTLAVDEAKTQEYYLADGAMEILMKDVSLETSIPIFLGEAVDANAVVSSLPTANDETTLDKNGTLALYYDKATTTGTYTVIYFGASYRTEITCVPGVSYEVSQTPRAVEPEGGEGGS